MNKVRIGYYLAGVEGGVSTGGVWPYAVRLLESLLASPIPVDFHLLITSAQHEYVQEFCQRWPNRQITFSEIRFSRIMNFFYYLLGNLIFTFGLRRLIKYVRKINYLEWQMRGHKIDIVHSPVQTLPTFAWQKPLIITMHDVQELHLPEFFSPRERAIRAQIHWWCLESATKIVVSFDHIKEDLIRYFQISPEKICVCPLPIQRTWLPDCDEAIAKNIRAKYHLHDSFLLYPAQTWKHKNHLGLLKALIHLRDIDGLTPQLICTGKMNSFYESIEQVIRQYNLQSQVQFLGIVPSDELAALYKQCYCVVVPTLYEAGSFPVIEAMMLGAPVICSQTTSLPETIGDLRFTFDANRPIDIARSLRQVLTDEQFRMQNIENGTQRIQVMLDNPGKVAESVQKMYETLA